MLQVISRPAQSSQSCTARLHHKCALHCCSAAFRPSPRSIVTRCGRCWPTQCCPPAVDSSNQQMLQPARKAGLAQAGKAHQLIPRPMAPAGSNGPDIEFRLHLGLENVLDSLLLFFSRARYYFDFLTSAIILGACLR